MFHRTKMINVYIDGACEHNGKPNAVAGYAVYFGPDDPRNEYACVIGKQSNNTGELTAFIRCLQILGDSCADIINIYTDSEYVMKCVTTYGDKLARKGWDSPKVAIVPNIELVQMAHTLFKACGPNARLHHIRAHTDADDIHSKGNAEADRLARLSIGGHIPRPNTKKETKIKLDWITYGLKEEAKKYGARWNAHDKYWYVTSDEHLAELKNLKPQKTILHQLESVQLIRN